MKNQVKSERVRIGLNQAELGAALNPPVSERTVREWEKSNSPISSFQLLNLIQLFHCSVDYLLGLTDERTSRAS